MDWKKEAIRWRRAFWAAVDDDEFKKETKAAKKKKRAAKPKKAAKAAPKKRKVTHKKRSIKQFDLF